MVAHPLFKLIAKGSDITQKIKKNLISLSYEDKEDQQSDEISFVVSGIYAKPAFGDELELWLGYVDSLFLCGSFSVQSVTRDYKANTTEVRATAVNFASPQKLAKNRTWEATSLFDIAKKIADENSLALKTTGENLTIKSILQENVGDLDFLYGLCFEHGYIMKVANNTVIIAHKESPQTAQATQESSQKNLPRFSISLSECHALSLTQANRHSYTSVILEWHDSKEGARKSLKVGSGSQSYKLQIPEPKSEAEAYKRGEAKLSELMRGGISGNLSCAGREIRAGGKLEITEVAGIEGLEFSIKSVSHRLDSRGYFLDVEFEG